MARITFGLGTSHTPQLNTPPETWAQHGERDKGNPFLYDKAGKHVSYAELLAQADPRLAQEIDPDRQRARFEACERGIAVLQQALRQASPDVLVVFGDDQAELFKDDFRPAITIHWGETILNMPQLFSQSPDRSFRDSGWAYGAENSICQIDSGLARHMVEQLVASGFDITHSYRLPEGMGMGHAFGFIFGRVMNGLRIPLVPVILNTHYPPNQPTPARCWALGQAVRNAVESWEPDTRVGIVGSGGLSHFVIDEEVDRELIAALEKGDGQRLSALPPWRLQSGNSEIRSWIAAAGALEHLQMRLVDYVPCYRSPAGTGVAMGFAIWD